MSSLVVRVPTVKELHREFLRAGSDVMQAFTFYASDDKLKNRGNEAGTKFTVSYSAVFRQHQLCAGQVARLTPKRNIMFVRAIGSIFSLDTAPVT